MSDDESGGKSTTTIPSSFGTSSSGTSGMVHKYKVSSGSGSGFYEVDAARELGLDLENRQYAIRLQALTSPKEYAQARQEEFDKVVAGVKKVYHNSYTGFSNAGMPHEMAKNYALAAANAEKQVRHQVLETLYPSGANLIGDAAMVRSMTGSVANLTGTGGQAPRRRRAAPRKRAAPRRRR